MEKLEEDRFRNIKIICQKGNTQNLFVQQFTNTFIFNN